MSSIIKNLSYRPNHGPLDVEKLSEIIEAGFDTYNTERYRQKKSFAPSQIGFGHGKCPRYWYIAFDGAMFVEENDATGIGNMKSGIASHERIGDLLKRSDLQLKGLEVKLEHDDPPIFGYIDVIVDRKGEEVVGEIKTTRTESFRSKQAKMKPPDYHLIQILIYMYLREAESGFFLYENKNDHQLLVMPVYMTERNKEFVEYAFGWMREVREMWEQRKLNKVPFRKNSKICKGCPVRDTCFDPEQYGEGEDLIAPLRLLQP